MRTAIQIDLFALWRSLEFTETLWSLRYVASPVVFVTLKPQCITSGKNDPLPYYQPPASGKTGTISVTQSTRPPRSYDLCTHFLPNFPNFNFPTFPTFATFPTSPTFPNFPNFPYFPNFPNCPNAQSPPSFPTFPTSPTFQTFSTSTSKFRRCVTAEDIPKYRCGANGMGLTQ